MSFYGDQSVVSCLVKDQGFMPYSYHTGCNTFIKLIIFCNAALTAFSTKTVEANNESTAFVNKIEIYTFLHIIDIWFRQIVWSLPTKPICL